MRRKLIALAATFIALIAQSVSVSADVPVIRKSVTITNTSTDIVVQGLSGQSSCTIEINGTASGTVKGIVQGVSVNVNAVQIPDGGSPSYTITGPGQFTANCAGMSSFLFHPTSVTGSVTITIDASAAVGRIIGAGVNGGRTNVTGSAPVVVSNSGSTTTIALSPLPIPLMYGGTGATALPTGCLQSDGTQVSSTGSSCGQSYIAGTNINPLTGPTPAISVTAAPTFVGGATLGTFGMASGTTSPLIMGNGFGGISYITNGSGSAHGVVGDIFEVQQQGGGPLLAVNHTGNVGVANGLAAGDSDFSSLNADSFLSTNSHSVPYIAQAGQVTTAHIEVGAQNINAAAGTCTAGTLVTYLVPFGSTPYFALTTQGNVALHAEVSTATTPSATSFTPALCNTSGSPILATVWYTITGY